MIALYQENHRFYAQPYHIGLASHVMKIMIFWTKMDMPNIWKQDAVVITKIILSHLMTNIPVHTLGNIVWKVKNVFLKDGTVLKNNVSMMINIFIVTNLTNAFPKNGFAMDPFNVPLQQKMKHLNFVSLNRHFHKEPQSSV